MKDDACHCHDWFVAFNGGFNRRPSNMVAYVAYGFVRALNFIRGTDEDEDDEIDDKPCFLPSMQSGHGIFLHFSLDAPSSALVHSCHNFGTGS